MPWSGATPAWHHPGAPSTLHFHSTAPTALGCNSHENSEIQYMATWQRLDTFTHEKNKNPEVWQFSQTPSMFQILHYETLLEPPALWTNETKQIGGLTQHRILVFAPRYPRILTMNTSTKTCSYILLHKTFDMCFVFVFVSRLVPWCMLYHVPFMSQAVMLSGVGLHCVWRNWSIHLCCSKSSFEWVLGCCRCQFFRHAEIWDPSVADSAWGMSNHDPRDRCSGLLVQTIKTRLQQINNDKQRKYSVNPPLASKGK